MVNGDSNEEKVLQLCTSTKNIVQMGFATATLLFSHDYIVQTWVCLYGNIATTCSIRSTCALFIDPKLPNKHQKIEIGFVSNSASWKLRRISENGDGKFILLYKLELKSANS